MKKLLTLILVLFSISHYTFADPPPTPPNVHPSRAVMVGTVVTGNTSATAGDYIVARNSAGQIIGMAIVQYDPNTGSTYFNLTIYGQYIDDGESFNLFLYETATGNYSSLAQNYTFFNRNGGILPGFATLLNVFDFNPTGGVNTGGVDGVYGVPLIPYEWIIGIFLIMIISYFIELKIKKYANL